MSRLIAMLALAAALLGLGWWLWDRGSLDFLPKNLHAAVSRVKSAIGADSAQTEGEGGSGRPKSERPQEPDPEFKLIKEAATAAGDGDLVKARDILRGLLTNPAAAPHLAVIKSLLGEVNLTLLLEPGPAPGKTPYVVQAGDAIAKIASKTGAPAELIVRSNNLQGLTIRKGDTLHIPVIDAAVVIYLRHAVLQLFDGDNFLKEYPIREMRLPPGAKFPLETTVQEKISAREGERVAFGDPAYFSASRTITLRAAGFNIHAPGSDNKPGLVPGGTGFRLDPADLDEIFLLVKRGTPVQILAE